MHKKIIYILFSFLCLAPINIFAGTSCEDKMYKNYIFFLENQYLLYEYSEEILSNYVKELKSHKYVSVLIYGHASTVGKDIHNKILSKRRVKSVSDYLKLKGYDTESIKIAYGEERALHGLEYPQLDQRIDVKISAYCKPLNRAVASSEIAKLNNENKIDKEKITYSVSLNSFHGELEALKTKGTRGVGSRKNEVLTNVDISGELKVNYILNESWSTQVNGQFKKIRFSNELSSQIEDDQSLNLINLGLGIKYNSLFRGRLKPLLLILYDEQMYFDEELSGQRLFFGKTKSVRFKLVNKIKILDRKSINLFITSLASYSVSVDKNMDNSFGFGYMASSSFLLNKKLGLHLKYEEFRFRQNLSEEWEFRSKYLELGVHYVFNL